MRVALVTGGTDGIGKATARRLAADGWEVVLTGRSAARCEAAVAEIQAAVNGAKVSALVGDLSRMGDVKQLAAAFRAAHERLDALVLNANAISQERVITADGFEQNHAIGYFGRALLAWALEDTMKATAGAQVLSVVGLNLDRVDFDDPTMGKRYSAGKALGRWQWAVQVFAREWNRRSPVAMNVFMPGLVRTKILANEPQPMRAVVQLMNLIIGIPVEKSAAEVAAVLDDVARSGQRDGYYARAKRKPPRELKTLPGDGERLWEMTGRLLASYR